MEELKIRNRISLLRSRQADNDKIIKKLERRLARINGKKIAE